MLNENELSEDGILSEAELGKAIDTLLDIENMDDRPLYVKVKKAIARKRAARRRRIIWMRASAASVALVLIVGGIWLATDNGTGDVPVDDGNVRLTFADGRNFDLTNGSVADSLLVGDNVLIKVDQGTLYVEADGEAENASSGYNTLEVPKGRQYDIVLSDGSHVWLNSDSRLHFPSAFKAGERRVFVEGEVYFEVVDDARRPFVVEMGVQVITVLGTAFNIYSYDNVYKSVTTLFTGSLKVTGKDGGREATLIPGQQSVLDHNTGEIGVREADMADDIAWRRNIINLEKRTLEEITAYLSRIYNVEFKYLDDNARKVRFRGDVTRSADVETVLMRLNEVSGVSFTRNGNHIDIRI